MNPLNFKNQKKVLKILIDMCNQTESGIIYEPHNFESNFPFVDSKSLDLILDILHEKELISMLVADIPDSFDIGELSVTAKGYDFIPQVSYDTRQKWLERLWGFITGSVFTVIVGHLLQSLLV